jgi:hypothetical protein
MRHSSEARMNRRVFGTLGAMAVLVGSLSSCKKDPLSDLDGKPVAIVKQFSQMHIAVGDSATFTASVVDGRFTPLDEPITFTVSGTPITVIEDTSYDPVPHTSTRARVKAVAADTAYVIIQSGGLRDSVRVFVP